MIDGSEASKRALQECVRLVDREKDTVECITFDVDGSGAKLKDVCIDFMANSAKLVHYKFTTGACAGDSVPNAVAKYLTREDTPDYDFVVLGSKGAGVYKKPGTHYLGTVAEKVLTSARTNLLLVVK